LNVQVQEESATQKVLDIEVTPEEVGEELERVVADYARRVQLPGFRRGKVPRSVLESRFGPNFQHETIERAIEKACRQAFTERNIAPLMPAEVEDLKVTPNGPISFRAIVEVRPEVEAKDYKGLAVVRRTREITDADVERELEAVHESTARWSDVDRPAHDGDVLVVDYVRLDAKGQTLNSSRRRDYEILLGGEGLLPAFQAGLTGASAGESRTLKVDYPEEFGNAELAGKSVQFHVKVKKIREKNLPARDDNWAKEMLGAESLDEVRGRIRLNLEGEAKLAARREVEEALVEQVVAKNPVPVPERWMVRKIAEEVEDLEKRGGQPVPEAERANLEARIRESIERQVRREFLLEAIARQESLEVTDPEVGEEMSQLLQAGGRVAQEFRALPAERRRERVRDVLERRKVFDFLLENAQVSEETASNPTSPAVPTSGAANA
jgi:trigger factor